ncbi:hypothetical protein CTAYLR_009912 [Chrysophaeum taylorii]|uniref:BART domain-containing protein n=1 Tax=Chrysophaeum taylorii TaxID=2483200 RepID=A0AAD7UAG3_9STRA|nr:hypothetical protein CTAYLR_009912 [Chrysophaeum taylorii]
MGIDDDFDAKALKGEDAPLPPIIQKAISYCWSNGFLDVFRKYFRENAKPFVGYPPKREMESAEHSLEHWDLFQEYLKLYERTLAEWLDDQGVGQSDFYNDVREVQRTTTDPKVQEFVYCLLASCDYDSFYSVMVREAMKLNSSLAPVKAEAKGGDDDSGDAKGASVGGKGEK